MCTFKWEVGLTMIKGIRIEMHNIGISSYMVGMAGFACRMLYIFNPAVKPFLAFYIGGNFFVAIEA